MYIKGCFAGGTVYECMYIVACIGMKFHVEMYMYVFIVFSFGG